MEKNKNKKFLKAVKLAMISVCLAGNLSDVSLGLNIVPGRPVFEKMCKKTQMEGYIKALHPDFNRTTDYPERGKTIAEIRAEKDLEKKVKYLNEKRHIHNLKEAQDDFYRRGEDINPEKLLNYEEHYSYPGDAESGHCTIEYIESVMKRLKSLRNEDLEDLYKKAEIFCRGCILMPVRDMVRIMIFFPSLSLDEGMIKIFSPDGTAAKCETQEEYDDYLSYTRLYVLGGKYPLCNVWASMGELCRVRHCIEKDLFDEKPNGTKDIYGYPYERMTPEIAEKCGITQSKFAKEIYKNYCDSRKSDKTDDNKQKFLKTIDDKHKELEKYCGLLDIFKCFREDFQIIIGMGTYQKGKKYIDYLTKRCDEIKPKYLVPAIKDEIEKTKNFDKDDYFSSNLTKFSRYMINNSKLLAGFNVTSSLKKYQEEKNQEKKEDAVDGKIPENPRREDILKEYDNGHEITPRKPGSYVYHHDDKSTVRKDDKSIEEFNFNSNFSLGSGYYGNEENSSQTTQQIIPVEERLGDADRFNDKRLAQISTEIQPVSDKDIVQSTMNQIFPPWSVIRNNNQSVCVRLFSGKYGLVPKSGPYVTNLLCQKSIQVQDMNYDDRSINDFQNDSLVFRGSVSSSDILDILRRSHIGLYELGKSYYGSSRLGSSYGKLGNNLMLQKNCMNAHDIMQLELQNFNFAKKCGILPAIPHGVNFEISTQMYKGFVVLNANFDLVTEKNTLVKEIDCRYVVPMVAEGGNLNAEGVDGVNDRSVNVINPGINENSLLNNPLFNNFSLGGYGINPLSQSVNAPKNYKVNKGIEGGFFEFPNKVLQQNSQQRYTHSSAVLNVNIDLLIREMLVKYGFGLLPRNFFDNSIQHESPITVTNYLIRYTDSELMLRQGPQDGIVVSSLMENVGLPSNNKSLLDIEQTDEINNNKINKSSYTQYISYDPQDFKSVYTKDSVIRNNLQELKSIVNESKNDNGDKVVCFNGGENPRNEIIPSESDHINALNKSNNPQFRKNKCNQSQYMEKIIPFPVRGIYCNNKGFVFQKNNNGNMLQLSRAYDESAQVKKSQVKGQYFHNKDINTYIITMKEDSQNGINNEIANALKGRMPSTSSLKNDNRKVSNGIVGSTNISSNNNLKDSINSSNLAGSMNSSKKIISTSNSNESNDQGSGLFDKIKNSVKNFTSHFVGNYKPVPSNIANNETYVMEFKHEPDNRSNSISSGTKNNVNSQRIPVNHGLSKGLVNTSKSINYNEYQPQNINGSMGQISSQNTNKQSSAQNFSHNNSNTNSNINSSKYDSLSIKCEIDNKNQLVIPEQTLTINGRIIKLYNKIVSGHVPVGLVGNHMSGKSEPVVLIKHYITYVVQRNKNDNTGNGKKSFTDIELHKLLKNYKYEIEFKDDNHKLNYVVSFSFMKDPGNVRGKVDRRFVGQSNPVKNLDTNTIIPRNEIFYNPFNLY